jgi:probable phosphoglycerate mutase
MALQCAATLLLARHGDAQYPHAEVMTDDGGWLTDLGIQQVGALAAAVAPERVARVFSSTLARAVESALLAGDALDLGAVEITGLEEIRVGECAGRPVGDPSFQGVYDRWIKGDLDARVPGAESGQEVLERVRGALVHIADQHRGETVLVFTHGGVMSFAVPRLSGNVPNDLAAGCPLPNAVPARVEIGDDGWRVLEWPEGTDKTVVRAPRVRGQKSR